MLNCCLMIAPVLKKFSGSAWGEPRVAIRAQALGHGGAGKFAISLVVDVAAR